MAFQLYGKARLFEYPPPGELIFVPDDLGPLPPHRAVTFGDLPETYYGQGEFPPRGELVWVPDETSPRDNRLRRSVSFGDMPQCHYDERKIQSVQPGRGSELMMLGDAVTSLEREPLGVEDPIILPLHQKALQAGKLPNIPLHPSQIASGGLDLNNFNPHGKINSYLIGLEQRYRFCKVINIGRTQEGRDMFVLQIGENARDGRKRAVWIDAGLQAMGWVAQATALYLIARIVAGLGLGQRDLVELLQDFTFFILPVANPDVYEGNSPVQRGRNPYDKADNAGGELCFMNIRDFIMSSRPLFLVYVSFHNQGHLWNNPWGHVKNMQREPGCAEEWARGVAGMKYSYTVELRDSQEPHHISVAGEDTCNSIINLLQTVRVREAWLQRELQVARPTRAEPDRDFRLVGRDLNAPAAGDLAIVNRGPDLPTSHDSPRVLEIYLSDSSDDDACPLNEERSRRGRIIEHVTVIKDKKKNRSKRRRENKRRCHSLERISYQPIMSFPDLDIASRDFPRHRREYGRELRERSLLLEREMLDHQLSELDRRLRGLQGMERERESLDRARLYREFHDRQVEFQTRGNLYV